MAKLIPFILLLLLAAASTSSTAVNGGERSSPRRLESSEVTPAQVRNIIEALMGAGDFSAWANMLFGLDPTALPVSSTIFVPADSALTGVDPRADYDPAAFQYHVVPRGLTFAQLRRFHPGDRLPTLLRNRTILVTDAGPTEFALDGVLVTHPDVLHNDAVSVHGLGGVLDYKKYGFAASALVPLQQSSNNASSPSLEHSSNNASSSLEQSSNNTSSPPPLQLQPRPQHPPPPSAGTVTDTILPNRCGASCSHSFAFVIFSISMVFLL